MSVCFKGRICVERGIVGGSGTVGPGGDSVAKSVSSCVRIDNSCAAILRVADPLVDPNVVCPDVPYALQNGVMEFSKVAAVEPKGAVTDPKCVTVGPMGSAVVPQGARAGP